jgi:hypothetical protein
MALKINRNDDDKIVSVKTGEGVFSYAFLTTPRPESDFKSGTYGTDFIIRDKETLAALKEYLNQVMKSAKDEHWGGKIPVPAKLHIPLKKGDEDNELTKGAYVLKTATKNMPKVLIRDTRTGRAIEIDEDRYGEIYSGMVGEIIVTFKGYSFSGNKGITAYISAACKTGDGTPLGSRGNYEDEFSIETDYEESDFDEAEEEEVEEAPAKKGTTKKGTTTKKTTPKKEPEIDIDSLIDAQSDDSEDEEEEEEEVNVKEMSVDDFL